ncbi:hypothetical protein Tco_0503352 [Tanacetum coccineum]
MRRPFHKSTAPNTSISNEKDNTVRVKGVNTARQTTLSTVKGSGVTAVKALAGCVWIPKMTDLNNGNSQQALKNQGIFDSGCSRHMIGNKDFLIDYQDIDGGFVAFGGSVRGGKITRKEKIRTDKLDFEDVFFVKELKFNLFFVSQMCDKKNSVLFIETQCLVLSPNFKLLDESQVLLRVLRQSNMYSFDLKNVVPSGDLTWNQTNKNACPQEANGNTGLKQSVDARQSEEKNVSTQQYIMFLLWSSISSSYKSSYENDTVDDSAVYVASAPRTSNDAGPSSISLGRFFLLNVNDLPDDPLMPNLEDTVEVQNTGIFGIDFDDEDLDTYNSPFADQVMGAEADFNNMEPSTVVSPIPTTRVHSIHPKDQIIGDLKSAVQTRGMTKKSSGEHAMISYIQKQKRTNHKDFQNCLFACFLSQQEPTNIAQVLDDESWVEAMQEDLLQFKI